MVWARHIADVAAIKAGKSSQSKTSAAEFEGQKLMQKFSLSLILAWKFSFGFIILAFLGKSGLGLNIGSR